MALFDICFGKNGTTIYRDLIVYKFLIFCFNWAPIRRAL